MSVTLPTKGNYYFMLLDINKNIVSVQQKIQPTYSNLKEIKFDKSTLQNSKIKKFKCPQQKTWKNFCETIQKTTESKSTTLIQSENMYIVEGISNLVSKERKENKESGKKIREMISRSMKVSQGLISCLVF